MFEPTRPSSCGSPVFFIEHWHDIVGDATLASPSPERPSEERQRPRPWHHPYPSTGVPEQELGNDNPSSCFTHRFVRSGYPVWLRLRLLSPVWADRKCHRQAPSWRSKEVLADPVEALTDGLQSQDGFVPVHFDEETGRILLEVTRLDEDFLYAYGLASGLGYPVGVGGAPSGASAAGPRTHRVGKTKLSSISSGTTPG